MKASRGSLLAVSDLHVDYPENRRIADGIVPGSDDDWLIVAGDVGEIFSDIERTLSDLRQRFAEVIWAPGNHELWTLPRSGAAPRQGPVRGPRDGVPGARCSHARGRVPGVGGPR